MTRIPHPVTLTQAVTRTRGGRFLILLALGIVVGHNLEWFDAVPNQDGMPQVDCDRLAAQVADVTTTTVEDGPCTSAP